MDALVGGIPDSTIHLEELELNAACAPAAQQPRDVRGKGSGEENNKGGIT